MCFFGFEKLWSVSVRVVVREFGVMVRACGLWVLGVDRACKALAGIGVGLVIEAVEIDSG